MRIVIISSKNIIENKSNKPSKQRSQMITLVKFIIALVLSLITIAL